MSNASLKNWNTKLPFFAPKDFLTPNFLRPFRGACRGQVHEVDTGDKQNEKSDERKDAYVLDTTPGKIATPFSLKPLMAELSAKRLSLVPLFHYSFPVSFFYTESSF